MSWTEHAARLVHKNRTVSELIERLQDQFNEASLNKFPPSFSHYGGWLQKRFKATDFSVRKNKATAGGWWILTAVRFGLPESIVFAWILTPISKGWKQRSPGNLTPPESTRRFSAIDGRP